MKKINHNRVLNIVAALLVAVSLMCSGAVQVRAYTADTSLTGYPFIMDDLIMQYNFYDDDGIVHSRYFNAVSSEQNAYLFSGASEKNIYDIYIWNRDAAFVFPYQPDLYDYYVVGNIAGGYGSFFDINSIEMAVVGPSFVDSVDINVYDFDTSVSIGKSFSFKLSIEESDNVNFSGIRFLCNSDDTVVIGDLWFCASILPVAKGTEAEQLNQAILNELIKINQNLVTANTLQQQTIDAIKDHDTNVGNWFTTLTSNLGNWFQQLYTSMGVGFEKLYRQMTEEQDEQLHGYEGSAAPDANEEFSAGSSELTAIEGQLSDQSTTYVDDFTTSGFDASTLSTLGSSLTFVVTWFTNFWNMGGVWTAGLNICFAISIAFYILRTRSK